METVRRLCLRWDQHSPHFASVFSQLLTSETLVDVTLSAEGQQLHAHRIILSACSNYFQELFVSNPCRHPIVILKDVSFEDLASVVHFIYNGEVEINQNKLKSVLKTAELLKIKGLFERTQADDHTEDHADYDPPHSPFAESSFEQTQLESKVEQSEMQRKKRKLVDSRHSGSSAESWELRKADSLAPSSVGSRDYVLVLESEQQAGAQATSENRTRAKERSASLLEQSAVDPLHLGRVQRGESEDLLSSSKSSSTTNGSGSSTAVKKRLRPLFRQQCVKNENDQAITTEGEALSPGAPSKSPPLAGEMPPRSKSLLQVPTTSQLPRQRSQPILPSQTSIVSTPSVTPISFLQANIPTVAVTPASSTPNIVIDQYSTIVGVVSLEDMQTVHGNATLIRSQSGTSSLRPTLQVPVSADDNSTATGRTLLKARLEETLKRSVSNPGLSSSSSAATSASPNAPCSTSGHCPVLRSGAALGCNYCWNTVDDSGRTLRRKTKYYCPDCQTNLCIVPCFQLYHEKTTPETGKSATKSPSASHQFLSKMSSI